MKYNVTGGFATDDVSELDQHLRQEPRLATATIEFELPIPIQAMLRRTGDTQKVLLSSGQSMQALTRHTHDNKDGDLGVTCNPEGDEVDIETINLPFRQYDDTLTNRGLIWVVPGEPAVAMLELKPQGFCESNESMAGIIIAAEAAVQSRVLRHFTH